VDLIFGVSTFQPTAVPIESVMKHVSSSLLPLQSTAAACQVGVTGWLDWLVSQDVTNSKPVDVGEGLQYQDLRLGGGPAVQAGFLTVLQFRS
jgi:hypothetical protein